MVVTLIAIVAVMLFTCSSGMVSATNRGAIYSNMVQETQYETYDCAGYTVRAIKNHVNELEIYFTAHEGNCSIEGEKAEQVTYLSGKGSLSFSVPFQSSEGVAYYQFKGRLTKSSIEGQLRIEYPSRPKFNKTETLKLWRTTEKQLFPER